MKCLYNNQSRMDYRRLSLFTLFMNETRRTLNETLASLIQKIRIIQEDPLKLFTIYNHTILARRNHACNDITAAKFTRIITYRDIRHLGENNRSRNREVGGYRERVARS